MQVWGCCRRTHRLQLLLLRTLLGCSRLQELLHTTRQQLQPVNAVVADAIAGTQPSDPRDPCRQAQVADLDACPTAPGGETAAGREL